MEADRQDKAGVFTRATKLVKVKRKQMAVTIGDQMVIEEDNVPHCSGPWEGW